jgi:hypothetical protein
LLVHLLDKAALDQLDRKAMLVLQVLPELAQLVLQVQLVPQELDTQQLHLIVVLL